MRHLTALFLVAALEVSLPAAPPADNGDAGPRGILSPADVKSLTIKPPRTIQAVLKMVGRPARVYRTPVLPGLTIWEYRAATGTVEFRHKDGRVTDIFLPAGS
jgi:hypothetical protein